MRRPHARQVELQIPAWSVWRGNNRFYCGGRIIAGPSLRRLVVTVSLLLLTMLLAVTVLTTQLKPSSALATTAIILFSVSSIASCIALYASNPGVLPRAALLNAYVHCRGRAKANIALETMSNRLGLQHALHSLSLFNTTMRRNLYPNSVTTSPATAVTAAVSALSSIERIDDSTTNAAIETAPGDNPAAQSNVEPSNSSLMGVGLLQHQLRQKLLKHNRTEGKASSDSASCKAKLDSLCLVADESHLGPRVPPWALGLVADLGTAVAPPLLHTVSLQELKRENVQGLEETPTPDNNPHAQQKHIGSRLHELNQEHDRLQMQEREQCSHVLAATSTLREAVTNAVVTLELCLGEKRVPECEWCWDCCILRPRVTSAHCSNCGNCVEHWDHRTLTRYLYEQMSMNDCDFVGARRNQLHPQMYHRID